MLLPGLTSPIKCLLVNLLWSIFGLSKLRWGKSGNSDRFGLQIHCGQWLQPWNSKMLAPWKESYGKPQRQKHCFADKGPYSQSYSYSSSHVQMWELDRQEGWRIDAFELWCWRKLLRVPWTARTIKLIYPKANQSWIFIGRTDAEAEASILWPLDVKNQLTEKDPDAGKDWGQEEKGVTEDEMVGWHHQLDEHEFEQILGADEGQGGLSCCSSWGHKELDTT